MPVEHDEFKPYANQDELVFHEDVIRTIASEMHRPVDEVKSVYERELVQLKRDAKITDYLAVFAARRARESLDRSSR